MENKKRKEKLYSISEKLLRQLHSEYGHKAQTLIADEFPELFRNLEVGKWYSHIKTDAVINFQPNGKNCFGISNFGNWIDDYTINDSSLWVLSNKEDVLKVETIKNEINEFNTKKEEPIVEWIIIMRALVQTLKELHHGFINSVNDSEINDILDKTHDDFSERQKKGEPMDLWINGLKNYITKILFYNSGLSENIASHIIKRLNIIISDFETKK